MPTDAVPARRRRMSAVERRAAILDAARELFIANGYTRARTKEIAELCGINEAILYQHFASKDEIFEQAILVPLQQGIDDMTRQLAEVLDETEGADRISRMQALEAALVDHLQTLEPLFGIALFSDQRVSEGERVYRGRAFRVFEDSEIGDLPERLGWEPRDLDRSMLITLWLGFVNGLILDAHFRGVRISKKKLVRELTNLFVYGLSAPPDLTGTKDRALTGRAQRR